MKKDNELKYYIAIAIIVTIYWIAVSTTKNISPLSTIFTTTTTLIAAVAFWLQLKRTQNLNEANFIMNLNNQFISNSELTKIEHALELYYNSTKDNEKASLSLTLERDAADCQRLINYLVYMEGLAALIKQNVMHLNVIDDLFAYRFFIAVNNPEVQNFELRPYRNYYQGCIWLSEMWTKQWESCGRTIPLHEYSLFRNLDSQTEKAMKPNA